MSGICSKHQHYDKDCEICNAKYGVLMNTHITSILPQFIHGEAIDKYRKGYNDCFDACAEAIERAVEEGKLIIPGMTDKEISQIIDKAFCMAQQIEARRVINERT